MNWKLKSVIQRGIGGMWRGHDVNYLFQRHITRSLPSSLERLGEADEAASWMTEAVARTTGSDASDQHWLEFGAGWDLAGALARSARGVESQVLFDLHPVARPWLVAAAAKGLAELGRDLDPVSADDDLPAIAAHFGCDYRAPADVRTTGLPDGSVDVVCSTSVLEHVDPADISLMLVEFRRVMRPGGLCVFIIDYHDHWAGSDASIGTANFLQFSEAEWRRWNCPMQYQNRLRHNAYAELFAAAGFETVEEHAIDDDRLVVLPPLDPAFADRDDLRIGDGRFILRSP